MNSYEQSVLEQAMQNYAQLIQTGNIIAHEGTSKLVSGMIVHDICCMNPSLDINNYKELVAFANQFSCIDGLLPISSFMGSAQDPYLLLNRQIAITTIWIAQFTKEISIGKTAMLKKQRSFQTCLLVYFFNQIIGSPPAGLSKAVDKQTVKRYGLYDWYFDYSCEHELRKSMLLFDVMHLCSLEYINPIDEVINI